MVAARVHVPCPPTGRYQAPHARDLWRAYVEARPSSSWSALDLSLIDQAVGLDLEAASLTATLAAEGLLIGGKAHPAIAARDAILRSLARLRRDLKLNLDADSARRVNRGAALIGSARRVLSDVDGCADPDGLLALPV